MESLTTAKALSSISTPTSTVASSILFGTIIFTYVCLHVKSSHDPEVQAALASPLSKKLNLTSYTSIYSLLHHTSVFGLILLFAYLCEYHPIFPHGEKAYDRDKFYFITGLLFFASAYTISKNDKSEKKKSNSSSSSSSPNNNADSAAGVGAVKEVKACNEVLNRDQTEEWKGWMQFVFLLYHYYHAEEVYNSIRIMITCYVWMTGFGNFSFFYLKDDYSLIRVLQMLWRLNFLVLFLCLTQGTTYILYYICPLHTFFFLMVFVTMRFFRSLNYSKYGLRIKLFLLAIGIYFVWDVDSGLFKLLHPFLTETPMLGATNGSMWEWYFRSSLDHWSTFLGMVFAANFPITSLWYRKLEQKPRHVEILGKASVGLVFAFAFGWWVTGPFQEAKLQYNQTNAYYGFIPMITYIYFRNLTPTLRSYSLDLLHQIGKTTLETYLMQHHIWLTSDAKSLLILVPGYPYCNFLIVSIIYFYTSRRLYALTLYLRGMFLPNDSTMFCLYSLISIALIVAFAYASAFALQLFGATSLFAVGCICSILGFYFYKIITLRTTIADGTRHASNNANTCSPPLAGLLVLGLLGITWHSLAVYGAGKIQSLPETCSMYVHDGAWIPLQPCTNDVRGKSFRSNEVSDVSCTSTTLYAWGWKKNPSSSRCRFVHRNKKTLGKALANRKITFVGDSMVRNMYYATLRAHGVATPDYFDTTLPKHTDMTNEVGSTTYIFKWAPFATDQNQVLDQMIKMPNTPENSLDLIFIGGGSWDRLHIFDQDPNQNNIKKAVEALTNQVDILYKRRDIPTIWMIPTTIHDQGLKDEDKKQHMTDAQLQQMRSIQENFGLYKVAKFVLDGTSFTKPRVIESFDGVHYPPAVYDAGAQILANALDWVLLPKQAPLNNPPQPGKMAHPYLGMFMLCVAFVGLFLFDGFYGFTLIAGFMASGVWPCGMYEEAFGPLHQKMKLPPISGGNYVQKSTEMMSFLKPHEGTVSDA